MIGHGLLVRAVPTVVTGLVGAVAYEALRKAVKAPLRKGAVVATAWGMRVAREAERKAGQSAELARLTVADVMAEARERAGEDVAPLTVVDSGEHHDH
ncbi:DUF1490 family protein [Mycobacterium kansasii]|uniref:DUF1490 domain-containing protein n=1 Tax=Mycobacterium pseudokansasii TaxID=2341080 RepID=A0A498QMS4_9MYCO|nr:DUF1490 family protein [Mycobacterium pseudokansasii]KZS70784.1 hypothetical protein A4G27_25125 [Mycobacterium kansasii]VAZ93814.1 hypothetical protein LAUMK35_02421 [Mycobacterium pseudokansasii]VAZ94810.1 hypothetical protein LAUMK21_02422 [Mycobacterium pseudokansasii]VBA50002.1 hypothetical protein LAUMK142_02315 [Mycobacterium pseudokansasii]